MSAPRRRRPSAGGQVAAWLLAALALATCSHAGEPARGDGDGGENGGEDGAAAAVSLSWDDGGRVTAAEPLTAVVPIPPRVLASAAAEGRARLFLEGVEAPPSAIGLAVFLERPDATWDTARDVPEYVGSIAFGQLAAGGSETAESFVLDLGETLERLGGLAAVGDLGVTLAAVPRSRDPADVAAFLADPAPIRVRRVRLQLGGE